jgi:hypothetical protein
MGLLHFRLRRPFAQKRLRLPLRRPMRMPVEFHDLHPADPLRPFRREHAIVGCFGRQLANSRHSTAAKSFILWPDTGHYRPSGHYL